MCQMPIQHLQLDSSNEFSPTWFWSWVNHLDWQCHQWGWRMAGFQQYKFNLLIFTFGTNQTKQLTINKLGIKSIINHNLWTCKYTQTCKSNHTNLLWYFCDTAALGELKYQKVCCWSVYKHNEEWKYNELLSLLSCFDAEIYDQIQTSIKFRPSMNDWLMPTNDCKETTFALRKNF